jgi:hypothetical protein
MIVGGYAVAFHGFVRFTKDIDIFFLNDDENVGKLFRALCDFGFNAQDIPEPLFREKGAIIKFGIEPVRIDLINEISAVNFLEAEPNVIRGKYGNTTVTFIGPQDLLKNKKSTGRPQDSVDAERLEQKQRH